MFFLDVINQVLIKSINFHHELLHPRKNQKEILKGIIREPFSARDLRQKVTKSREVPQITEFVGLLVYMYSNGKKIADFKEHERSKEITEQLECMYN